MGLTARWGKSHCWCATLLVCQHFLVGDGCSIWVADDAPDDGLVRAAVNGTDLGFPTCESHGGGPDTLRTPGAGEQVSPRLLTPAHSL